MSKFQHQNSALRQMQHFTSFLIKSKSILLVKKPFFFAERCFCHYSSGFNLSCASGVICGPGISVGIATELWAGRSVIESRRRLDCPRLQTGPGTHPASCTMGTGSFPGVKWAGRGIDQPPTSTAEVKEKVS